MKTTTYDRMSGKRDLNPRPSPWQGQGLPFQPPEGPQQGPGAKSTTTAPLSVNARECSTDLLGRMLDARARREAAGEQLPRLNLPLSVGRAAKELGVTPRQVRRLIHDGPLMARRDGRQLFIERESLESFLHARDRAA